MDAILVAQPTNWSQKATLLCTFTAPHRAKVPVIRTYISLFLILSRLLSVQSVQLCKPPLSPPFPAVRVFLRAPAGDHRLTKVASARNNIKNVCRMDKEDWIYAHISLNRWEGKESYKA